MEETLRKINDIKQNGYHLDLGEAISQSFENYKKIALLAGAVILLLMVLLMIIVGGAVAVIFGVASMADSMTDFSAMESNSSFILITLGAAVLGYGLIAPLYAGILQMAHNAETGQDYDIGTAFIHYKSKHFKHIFLAGILITLFTSGISTVLDLLHLNMGNGPQDPNMLAFLGGLINILVSIFTFLTFPLIIFGNLNATQAIAGSFTLVAKRFWLILLLLIIFIVFMMLGIFALCIGIFFTIPIIYSLQYIIYRNAMPMDDRDELDEIGETGY